MIITVSARFRFVVWIAPLINLMDFRSKSGDAVTEWAARRRNGWEAAADVLEGGTWRETVLSSAP